MKWEENYQVMLDKILKHSRFGKMNPIDIGIECGYSENEVKNMIDCAREIKEELEPEIIYFILKESQNTDVLISVNTKSYEVKKIRELTMENNKVKNHILVSYGEAEDDFEDDFGDDYEIWDDEDEDDNRCIIIRWENLKTGKKEEMWYDFEDLGHEISDVWIIKSGIVIYSGEGIYLMPFDGRLSERIDMDKPNLILEDDNSIYSVSNTEILKIDGNFTLACPDDFEVSKISSGDIIVAVGVEDGKFYFYTNDYRVCGKNQNREKIEWKNKKISKSQMMFVTDNYKLSGHGVLKEKSGVSSEIVLWLGGRTNNIGDTIFSIVGEVQKEFGRDVVALPSQDVLLGVINKNEIVRLNLNENVIETIYKL